MLTYQRTLRFSPGAPRRISPNLLDLKVLLVSGVSGRGVGCDVGRRRCAVWLAGETLAEALRYLPEGCLQRRFAFCLGEGGKGALLFAWGRGQRRFAFCFGGGVWVLCFLMGRRGQRRFAFCFWGRGLGVLLLMGREEVRRFVFWKKIFF
jgi:hypothetical protein